MNAEGAWSMMSEKNRYQGSKRINAFKGHHLKVVKLQSAEMTSMHASERSEQAILFCTKNGKVEEEKVIIQRAHRAQPSAPCRGA